MAGRRTCRRAASGIPKAVRSHLNHGTSHTVAAVAPVQGRELVQALVLQALVQVLQEDPAPAWWMHLALPQSLALP